MTVGWELGFTPCFLTDFVPELDLWGLGVNTPIWPLLAWGRTPGESIESGGRLGQPPVVPAGGATSTSMASLGLTPPVAQVWKPGVLLGDLDQDVSSLCLLPPFVQVMPGRT